LHLADFPVYQEIETFIIPSSEDWRVYCVFRILIHNIQKKIVRIHFGTMSKPQNTDKFDSVELNLNF
jgi:hypothetical protein